MNNQNDNLKNKVFSSLMWKFGERIGSQLISLIVSVVLARLLTPESYGIVAIVMIFITIADVFVINGFGNALIQKQNVDNIDFSSVFFVNILISIAIYILLFSIAPVISSFYDMEILTPIIRVLSLRVPLAAINSIQQAYVSRQMLFERFFWSTLFGSLFSGMLGILLAFYNAGVWALVIQNLSNMLINTIVLWFTVKWRPSIVFSWKKTKALLSFGWKILISGLLETGYNQLRSLFIGKLYTSADLAFYNQGDKFPNLIAANINASITSVLFPAIASIQDDKIRVKLMTRKSIQISSYVMWPLMIGMAAVAEPFIAIVLTESWLSCVPYLQIFCLSYGFWPIHTSNLQAITAMGRSDLYLKLEIIKKIVGIIILIIFIPYGPLAIAFSVLVSGLISSFINAYPNIKLLNYTYKEQFEDLIPPLLISLIMFIIVYPISYIEISNILKLILQILIGAIVYISISYFTKQQSFFYLLTIIRKKINI